MNARRLALASLLPPLLSWTSALLAGPPRVASTSPPAGATAVDPATSEFRIEFDRDMNPAGYSLCGGGPSFPKVTGSPRWTGSRVIVFPVRLEPDHDYALSVNCPSASNFKSLEGEPAIPHPVRFRTAPGAAPPPAAPSPVTRLREALRDQYSHRERVVRDWDALFAKLEPDLISARDGREFAERASQGLAAARDPHLFFRVGDAIVPTVRPGLTPNADAALLKRLVPGWKQRSPLVVSGRFEDGIGYILIASWQGDAAAFDDAHQALDEFAAAPGVVIDARFNAGGDERNALRFAARFARERVMFAQHRTRAAGAWGPVQKRFLDPDPDSRRRYQGRTGVLTGPTCFSSNEAFLLMMRAAGAKLVGQRSYGSSGNPQPVDLGNGVAAMIPSWEALDASGAPIEGVGVAPDIEAKVLPGDGRDAALDAALQWLRMR